MDCLACKFEAAHGTEECPHPVHWRAHACVLSSAQTVADCEALERLQNPLPHGAAPAGEEHFTRDLRLLMERFMPMGMGRMIAKAKDGAWTAVLYANTTRKPSKPAFANTLTLMCARNACTAIISAATPEDLQRALPRQGWTSSPTGQGMLCPEHSPVVAEEPPGELYRVVCANCEKLISVVLSEDAAKHTGWLCAECTDAKKPG